MRRNEYTRISDMLVQQKSRIASEQPMLLPSIPEFVRPDFILSSLRSRFAQVSTFCRPNLPPPVVRYSFQLPSLDQQKYIIRKEATLKSTYGLDEAAGMLPVKYDAELIKKALTQWQHVANIIFKEDNVNPELIFYKYKLKPYVSQNCNAQTSVRFLRGFVENINGTGYVAFNHDFFELCEDNGLIARKYKTTIHEIGHIVFGLHHPFNHFCIEAKQLVTSYSVMNYAIEVGADELPIFPMSPMLADITGAQYLFGANTTAAIGDTHYDLSEFTMGVPKHYKSIMAIWDSQGCDTFDASRLTSPSVHLDLRPWSRSDLGTGYVEIGDAIIENVKAGKGKATIVLNTMANVVDLRLAKETITLVTDPTQCDHDIIKGFNVKKDIIYMDQPETGNIATCELISQTSGTLIKFDENNSLYLKGVKAEKVRSANIVSGATMDMVQCEIFADYPSRFYADFQSAFLNGAIILFLTGMTKKTLQNYGCNEAQINLVMQIAQTLLILFSENWLSATGSCFTSLLFNRLGFRSIVSSTAGIIVSELLTAIQQATYADALVTAPARVLGSTLAGLATSGILTFGMWVQQKFNQDSSAPLHSIALNLEDPSKYNKKLL